MPDTFTPDQFSQTQPITPAGSTPCAKAAGKGKRSARKDGHQPATFPEDLRSEVWWKAGEIDRDAHQAGTVFGMVWEIMEDISSHAVNAEARGDKALLTASDRLYVLLNGVSDRIGTMRKAAEVITQLSGKTPTGLAHLSDDPVAQRYREYRAAEAVVNAPEHRADESPEIDAFHAAQNRFLAEPVTSLLGVLLKLELLAEVEDLEHEANSFKNSIPLGLIKDLRTALGRTE
jgi:hypothetical protein